MPSSLGLRSRFDKPPKNERYPNYVTREGAVAADGDLHLGYRPDELASSPYASFYRPALAPLSEPVREALLTGAVAHELMAPVSAAAALLRPGHGPVETGYSLAPGGEARVAVLTPMPGVTPAMWDWWFA